MSLILSSRVNDRLPAQVARDLSDGGTLATRLPGFSCRPAQITLATQIAEAMTNETIFLGEAGTGTGKSLGYLIPAVRSGLVTVISTANKALQDQLYLKDIPFLQRHVQPFHAALMKGMGNYACLDRIELARRDPDLEEEEIFQRFLSALDQPAFTGDLESLPFLLPGEIRARVNGESEQCAGKQCNFYGSCFIYAMRERVKRASIIVVNHRLLLLDAVLNHALLPDHDVLVIDEAHHLETEATTAFTLTVTPNQVYSLLKRQQVQDWTAPATREAIAALNALLWERIERLPFTSSPRLLLVQLIPEALALAHTLEELLKELRASRPGNQDEKATALYDKLLEQVDTLVRTMRQVFGLAGTNEWVYYAERELRTTGAYRHQVCMAPLSVASFLREKVFDKATILTSATLATSAARASLQGRSPFAYFRERVGLNTEAPIQECVLPHAFDYARNALLYLPYPPTLPEPMPVQSADRIHLERYLRAVADEMFHLVEASEGRAFLLFSSKRMLQECYARLASRLRYPLLRQGDLPRVEMVRRFQAEEGSVLFGLKTFWEGVDIAGDALSLVVMDKLPFAPPDDPVDQGRVNQMKARGQNWFGEFILPRVIIDLKQGMGRLLRTDTDRGVIALLDTRLSTRGYGRQVLAELPPAPRTSEMEAVRDFFRASTVAEQRR